MSIDPARLARIKARVLAAAALTAAAGCSSETRNVNEPEPPHINTPINEPPPADPSAAPTTPPPDAPPKPEDGSKLPPDPALHINTPPSNAPAPK